MSFTNDEWFIVRDIDGFINSSRALVFNSFGKKDQNNNDIDPLDLQIDKTHQEELDQVLSFDEAKVIITSLIKKQKHKTTINKTRYLLNDNLFIKIIQSLNDRMISNLLNSLVNKGLVDTAYDAEANDFVFWVKDSENKNQQPETD